MDFIIIILIILFLIGIFVAYFIGYKNGSFRKNKFWESELPIYRKNAILKSRAVLSGQFSEQLAPFLPDFNFNPNECRFIGKPIDFLVFKGMDSQNIDEIVFVEVKSGNAKLSSIEKNLKKAVKEKKVKWKEYRVPKEITDERNVEGVE
jgi:predicted Holliday junction resolvase-like endonuclease